MRKSNSGRTQRKYNREVTNVVAEHDDDMPMREMFEQFMFLKRAEALTRRTIQEYYTHYEYLIRWTGRELTAKDMTTELFCGWIAYMVEEMELAPNTVNIRVRTTRAFLRYAYEEKGWIKEPIHKRFKTLKAPIDTVEAFTPEEVKHLIASIDDSTYVGFRTKVIIFVLLDTMVRVSELVDMKRANLDLKNATIKLDAPDTKTREARIVPLSPKTVRILNEYLAETAEFNHENLFLSYEGQKISEYTVRENIGTYGKVAKIKDKRVSPHTFRHTAALFYIMNGGDPFSLQKILGHSHMNMVRRYIQMTSVDIKTQHHMYSPLNYVYK